jgi:hypothetical protein
LTPFVNGKATVIFCSYSPGNGATVVVATGFLSCGDVSKDYGYSDPEIVRGREKGFEGTIYHGNEPLFTCQKKIGPENMMMMMMTTTTTTTTTTTVIKFSSLFIYMVTQQLRGQLRSKHDQTDKTHAVKRHKTKYKILLMIIVIDCLNVLYIGTDFYIILLSCVNIV